MQGLAFAYDIRVCVRCPLPLAVSCIFLCLCPATFQIIKVSNMQTDWNFVGPLLGSCCSCSCGSSRRDVQLVSQLTWRQSACVCMCVCVWVGVNYANDFESINKEFEMQIKQIILCYSINIYAETHGNTGQLWQRWQLWPIDQAGMFIKKCNLIQYIIK